MLQSAARNYIAGDTISDAIQVATGLAERRLPTTLGYWDADGESPDDVLQHYVEALAALAPSPLDSYLSIKLPSLDYCERRVAEVVELAATVSRRVHFDALGIDSVDRTWALLAKLHEHHDHLRCTLPGRWQRSVADADWVVAQRLPVRVVKGQFADPQDPERDRGRGYLEVVEALAGRARHVSIATHEAALIAASLERLTLSGTPCDVEVLFGLGWHGALDVARRYNVPVRVYVPYGAAYLPYCLAEARRSPRLLCRVMIDAVKASLWGAG
jgi:proline dehydrogenase